MIKKSMSFIFFLLLTASVSGQGISVITNKHYIETLLGVNFNISRKNDISSILSLYNKSHIIPLGISYSYFPLKNWGLFADIYFSVNVSEKTIPVYLESKNSYIVKSKWNEYDNTATALLGISYRWENLNFIIRPRIGVGLTGSNVNSFSGTFKEKNSNSVYYANYKWKTNPDEIACILFGLNAGYKISQYIHVNFEAGYIRHLKHNTLNYRLRDAYENKIIEEDSFESHIGQYMNLRAGISIALGHRK